MHVSVIRQQMPDSDPKSAVGPLEEGPKGKPPQVLVPGRCITRVDDSFFIPFAKFLADDGWSAENLARTASGRSSLRGHAGNGTSRALIGYRSSVLETYLRWSLMRFSCVSEGWLSFPAASSGAFGSGFTYDVNQEGNVLFRDPRGRRCAEIDFLCLYNAHGVSASMILEISFNRHTVDSDFRRRLVREMFDDATPYLLQLFILRGAGEVRLTMSNEYSYKRLIALPADERFDEAAKILWEKDKKISRSARRE